MTREDAVRSAQTEAVRAQRPMTVYRFPAWRKDVYGVRDAEQLPGDAERFETFDAAGAAIGPLRLVKGAKPAPPLAADTQGSLF